MQQTIDTLTSYILWNNTYLDYAIALGIFFALLLALKIFQSIILARLRAFAKKTKTDIDDAFIAAISQISSPFYIMVAVYGATKYLAVNPLAAKTISLLLLIVLVYEAVRGAEHLITFGLEKYIKKSKKDEQGLDAHSEAMIRVAMVMIRAVLWGVAFLMVLSNLGVNVTSLIASFGIGGIAVALALQNVLSDMFSSFSIYIDKPFQVGDHIVVGEHAGTVKRIGLKTTRLQALRGEELVISNKELTSARIQNLKRLKKRREVFKFGVVYDTDPKKLAKIPQIVEEIVQSVDKAEFGRCHFVGYSASSLDFEAMYHIDTHDYMTFMNGKQQINLELLKAFKKEKIAFAYPTQTLFVHKS